VIAEFGISPILAIVPDNQDRDLEQEPADPQFWKEMCALEAAGATIALHGFRHLCTGVGKSLVPMQARSEFAGVDELIQRQWIRTGLTILRDQELNPKIWVAPRHGFDRATLQALVAEGIEVLSDGLTRIPFRRGGVTWIPQQLWGPAVKQSGLWTICIHCNSMRAPEVDALIDFIRQNARSFTSANRVLEEFEPRELDWIEQAYERLALLRIQASRMKRRLVRSSRRRRVA
jgi:hypothetical protein